MKNYAKMIGYWLLAEVLTLFINLTLAVSDNALLRIVCAVCTVGILLALMVQGGYSGAKSDKKAHREFSVLRTLSLGAAGALVPLLFTAGLLAARLAGAVESFYRIYKLMCAPFLPVCNLMCADVLTSSVPMGEIAVLFVLSLLPIPAAYIAYDMTWKDKTPEDAMLTR